MKCPSCGADIKDGSKFCDFCGSQITVGMQREREQLNKAGCPSCGSTNVTFNREKQGEIKGKKGTAVVRSTVGVCKDCGYTWHTQSSNQPVKKRKTWLWVLGWICIFPLPLTILMLRKKDMKPAVKYGIIAVAWIVYLLIGLSGGSSDTTSTETTKEEAIVVEQQTETPVVEEKTEVPVVEEKPAEEENIAVKYDNDFVASAKMTLDRFIANYDLSLAPQRWTIAKFDDTDTLIGMTDITYQDRVGKFIFVGTLNIENDKVTSVTPHYIEVNGEVLGDDNYCDDVFDTIRNLGIE